MQLREVQLTRRLWPMYWLVLVAMLTATAACGGKSSSFDANEGLELSRDRALVVRDETQDVDLFVQLARGEQRGTTVRFEVSGLPSGVTSSFSQASMTLDDFNVHPVRFNFTADRLAPVGQYSVIIRRLGGSQPFSKTLTLTIADFAVFVDADDTDVTLHPGDSHDIDVVLTRRGNSNGTAEMNLAGDVPDGIGWEISPARVLIDPDHTRVHVTLTLTADSDASGSDTETCRLRVLKGINHNESDGIDVHLTSD